MSLLFLIRKIHSDEMFSPVSAEPILAKWFGMVLLEKIIYTAYIYR